MQFRVSPSSLNLFKECKKCFWLKLHKKWQRPSGSFPSLPNGIDRVLKNYFDKCRQQNKLPSEFPEDHTLYHDLKELDLFRNPFKDLRWIDPYRHTLFGAVDDLIVHQGKVYVIDFKTKGSPPNENTHKYYEDQLSIYTFLLEKNGFSIGDSGYLLFYSPKEAKGSIIEFKTTLIKVPINLKRAELLFDNAVATLLDDCPENSCKWCEHTKSDLMCRIY